MNEYFLYLSILQDLADIATMVAQALYKQAGGAEPQLTDIKADPQIVSLVSCVSVVL